MVVVKPVTYWKFEFEYRDQSLYTKPLGPPNNQDSRTEEISVFLFLTNEFQVFHWNVDRKIQTSSLWETSARIPNDLNTSIEQQTPVFSYSRISDPGVRKSFQNFFLYVFEVFKSDFDGRNRFCNNKAYQLKCRVEMVYLAASGFLGMSWIRYKNK